MIIGLPKEIKKHEYRAAVTPAGVRELKKDGHSIIIEKSAGEGSGFPDRDYTEAGAEVADKNSLFGRSELIVKVKEPFPSEYELLRQGQAVFTYLHLAANIELTDILLRKNIAGFGYETLEEHGTLPLLMPMSEIAGRMAPIAAAFYLQKVYNGSGILMTGVEGVPPAKVLILGAGIVGMNAARVALGMGARVTVINRGIEKLKLIDELFRGAVGTLPATKENIESEALKADAVIGAVLIPGAKAPKLISREIVSKMKKGSVIVDVSVDQGGCIETTRPTTHDNPVYEVDGVIHYCVANMPGAYPRTSTLALTNKTLPYIKLLAKNGIANSARDDSPLRSALNTYKGKIMHRGLAESINKKIVN
ncbi:MAG: alanine dehydrogenase [Nitrospirae bacterium]|nr:alanine dehydrogenase [Nitrospirota bacterium]MBI4837871.1 alanine dehydrogenase [Nitrospirota bacterium]